MTKPRYKIMKLKKAILICFSFSLLWVTAPCFAQLEVVVHIWGEVRSPGEYRVPAGTNILELMSKAGGPTDYANLGKVKLTRAIPESERSITVNLKKYLEKENVKPLPVIRKGDVVIVPRNAWYRWRTFIKVVADVAIIANVYYWLTRD